MKLSDLTTDRAADVLCEIGTYIINITTDEALTAELKKKAEKANAKTQAEMVSFLASKISALLPILLKKHKDDVFGIVAALNDTTADAIAKQNIIKTACMIREAVKDKELVDFFKSCASAAGE